MLLKKYVIFTKYALFPEKNVFLWTKRFIFKNVFTKKTFFYREKYKWKCKKYISCKEKFQVESRFCKTASYSCVTLLTTYLAKKQKKAMFKVSNRNTRKRCLLISKITLKTSGRRHLTSIYLPEVTALNHVLNSFSKNIYQFAIKSLLSVLFLSSTARDFKNSRPIYVILWETRNRYRNIWFMKFHIFSIFYFWKNSPKNWQVFRLFTAISVSQS